MSQAAPRQEPVDDDACMMRRIAEGDREAFHGLYRRWAGRLLGVLRRRCASAGEAEDLLQEVFLTVWRKAPSYDVARGDVGGWLYTICRHRAIDRMRRRKPSESLDGFDLPVAAKTPELRVDLEQALAHLEPRESIALKLAYFGGLTYEETAHRLRVPVGTLKSRIRNGLRKMAQQLGA